MTNRLLDGPGPTLALDDTLLALEDARSLIRELPAADIPPALRNMVSLSAAHVEEVHSRYGPSGLWRLLFLANSHHSGEFQHFWKIILNEFSLLSDLPTVDVQVDNDRLSRPGYLDNFNWNVLQPDLSRKLYNPGCHPGYLVYGFGGPKILVSHPFRGVGGELYDVYGNSLDVVSSLIVQHGYNGTFLFMDNMLSLNHHVRGVPAWLLWFSLIAAHSDIVLFVKEDGKDFSGAQKSEIDFTPELVQKKVVQIAPLDWAREYPDDSGTTWVYGGPEGVITEEEFRIFEQQHALPLVENYAEGRFPHDRIIRIDEGGNISQFPLDYPLYCS